MVVLAVASARDLVNTTIIDTCALMVSDLATAAYVSKSKDPLWLFGISSRALFTASLLLLIAVFANNS